MNHKRRDFLKTAGSLTAGLAVAPFSGHLTAKGMLGETENKPKKFGLQLYSLRDVLPQDPKEVLKQVASLGTNRLKAMKVLPEYSGE